MERAGQLFSRSSLVRKLLQPQEMVIAAWPSAIGRRLGLRARAVASRGDALIVEVEDALWQKNLELLEPQILNNLKNVLGSLAPKRLEFRLAVPRRPPQHETVAARDESDRIADPTLSLLYRRSRRKAGA